MPQPYSTDLRWRIVWLSLTTNHTAATISELFNVSQSTVWRYTSLFQRTGDIQVRQRRNRPRCLMSEYEQVVLLRMILENRGIYLHEVKAKFLYTFGISASVYLPYVGH